MTEIPSPHQTGQESTTDRKLIIGIIVVLLVIFFVVGAIGSGSKPVELGLRPNDGALTPEYLDGCMSRGVSEMRKRLGEDFSVSRYPNGAQELMWISVPVYLPDLGQTKNMIVKFAYMPGDESMIYCKWY